MRSPFVLDGKVALGTRAGAVRFYSGVILDHRGCDTGSPKRVEGFDCWQGVILDHLCLSARCDTGSPKV